ncbi:DUF4038 domain-containing protein [Sphingobacterium olei]|uniref:DUF4038 domain-containing protein n=1 Tax=Sphingobacterium olei TaxID=2571155 RepID=A0A4U0NYJ3_9SPHI|nr:DUF4038 domain-containing protein [Sphingobacterium olei]TJZ59936.1 DUF4038 domain-containing protein [Sphingobacterium olei]
MIRSRCIAMGILILLQLKMVQAQSLKVATSSHYLQKEDGKPFVWIGDTAWELFHKLDSTGVDEYLTTRMEQGFTVIYAVVLAEHNGLSSPNAYGELPLRHLDPATPNLRYFEHIDYVVNKAQSLGLYLAVLPTWGSYVPNKRDGDRSYIFTPQNAYDYGSFLGSRYRNKPIVWVLGGDRNVDNTEANRVWDSMATGIQMGNGNTQLMSYHPAGESTSAYWFHKSPWLAFNMYQTGHARKAMPGYQYAEAHRLLDPPKPFLDGEPAYEDIPIKFWEYIAQKPLKELDSGVIDRSGIIRDSTYFRGGFFSDRDVRNQAYWGLLSGAMGFSYGNNAVWQFVEVGKNSVLPSLHTWREALRRPGAEQIKHLRLFMEKWDFSTFVPDQSIIYGINRPGTSHIRAATNTDRSVVFVYTPVNQVIVLNSPAHAQEVYKVSWFDPRNGRTYVQEDVALMEQVEFTPPEETDDCLLILELKK